MNVCLMSLNFFKAYDRVLLSFLLIVMKQIGISGIFCQLIRMMHHGARTRFILPGGLSVDIALSFSIRQGEPIAMLLYIIYIESLLLYIERRAVGHIIGDLRTVESYCDDLNIMTSDEDDLVMVDRAVEHFEAISGAVLSRDKKCGIIGFGGWRNRVNWPLQYLRSVREIKVFCVTII